MTIWCFDADSLNKPGVDFNLARAQGWMGCYIKMGGNNLRGNDPYLMTSNGGYWGLVDRALAAGLIVGSYWVTGGNDTIGAADFYLRNRHPGTTFDVLDNEDLDYGRAWSDGEAATFLGTLANAGLTNLFQYGSRDSLWSAGGSWPYLESMRVKAIVANYNNNPLVNCYPSAYPASLVKGHQYTSSASIGGVSAMDANAFFDDAFIAVKPAPITPKDEEMYIYGNQKNPDAPVSDTPYVYEVWRSPFDGKRQMALLDVNDAACVLAHPNLAVLADDSTITGLAKEANYRGPLPGLALSDDVIAKLSAQVQPVSADEVAQKTVAGITPVVQSIQVPKSGTIQLS